MLDRFTWFWQSAYRWSGDGLTVYLDPAEIPEGYEPGDVIFITHAHFDHFSPVDLEKVRTKDTVVVAPRDVANELSGNVVAVAPGDAIDAGGVKGQAVPAYNVAPGREAKHPRSKGWVGYVLTLGDLTIYHAGDTDHVPELEDVEAGITFLPVGGTFTMDAKEAAGLAKVIAPDIAVPMHYGFVPGCDSPTAADVFKREADPVRVELLQPRKAFELS